MRRRLGITLAGAIVAMIAPPNAQADAFKPTRFDDPSPGKCREHDCSVREAVIAANKLAGKDTVRLQEGRYELTIPDAGQGLEDVDPKSGDLNVTKPATVRGKGPGKTEVAAAFDAGDDRLFLNFAERGRVVMRDLKITGGQSGTEPGGGILVAGEKARLDNVVIASNAATDGGGGAPGGGIYSLAQNLEIVRSTLRGNLGTTGGGIHVPASIGSPRTTIRSSTISGNASYEGGGIQVDGTNTGFANPPLLDIVNSTVAENDAEGNGGGVSSVAGGAVLMSHTTVVENTANASDSSAGGNGGGLYVSATATFRLDDSILAGNEVGSDGAHPQCSGTFPGDANVVEPQNDGCGATYVYVPDAMIGPLQNNGGPTKTYALLPGSPAIRRAFACPRRDQRGVVRPDDCDSGAFERTPSDP